MLLAFAFFAMADSSPVPPAGAVQIAEYSASGVQIYNCEKGQWVFKAPEAELKDSHGKVVGSHSAGPSWKLEDGSSVVGEVLSKTEASVPTSVPELLLHVKSHAGKGALERAEYVTRVQTHGGQAPKAKCDGSPPELRVPYSAKYRFYSKSI